MISPRQPAQIEYNSFHFFADILVHVFMADTEKGGTVKHAILGKKRSCGADCLVLDVKGIYMT